MAWNMKTSTAGSCIYSLSPSQEAHANTECKLSTHWAECLMLAVKFVYRIILTDLAAVLFDVIIPTNSLFWSTKYNEEISESLVGLLKLHGEASFRDKQLVCFVWDIQIYI